LKSREELWGDGDPFRMDLELGRVWESATIGGRFVDALAIGADFPCGLRPNLSVKTPNSSIIELEEKE